MRPDPYKRARSRQYQAKHGMLPGNQKPKEADAHKHLPSNITQEQIDALADLDSETEFDNEDELVPDFSSLSVSVEAPIYKCPKNVMEILLAGKPSNIMNNTEVEALVLASLSQDLKSFIAEYTDEHDYIIENTIISPAAETKATQKVEISLENKAAVPQINSPSSTSVVRKEKLELEDWLDDVL